MPDVRRIDPELREVLDQIPKTPHGVFDLTDVPAMRTAVRQMVDQMAATAPDARLLKSLTESWFGLERQFRESSSTAS